MDTHHSIIVLLLYVSILCAKGLSSTKNSLSSFHPPFSVTRYPSPFHGTGDPPNSRQKKFYIFIPLSANAGYKTQNSGIKNAKSFDIDLSAYRVHPKPYLEENPSRNRYFLGGDDGRNQGPKSWGRPSNKFPQHPLEIPSYTHTANNFYPCPKLENALKKTQVKFNLAVDHKWNGLTAVEAELFKEDLASLCTVIRSDFHRATDKLRKYGGFSNCAEEDIFHKGVRKALEGLVASSQDRGWYKRLRWFVGSHNFHHIINEIATGERK